MSKDPIRPATLDETAVAVATAHTSQSPNLLRYPPCVLAACCIPWNDDNSFAEATFRRSVRNLSQNLTRHLYLFGTAGEGYAVTRGLFERVCRVFREEMSGANDYPMVGVISLSQMEILERLDWARSLGFRSFQISLPSWGALTEAETRKFFREVCGAFPDCEFLHYNLMRTKRLITPEEYVVLAEENPNLVATKNSTSDRDRIVGLLQHTPQLTHFFTESGYAVGSLVAQCGFLVSIASCNLQNARRYFEAGVGQDEDRLREMQAELDALVNKLILLGKAEAHMDGAYDKVFCRLHDPDYPLRLLPPYETLSDKTFVEFREWMASDFHHWSPTNLSQ